jgi:hypothetical protein
MVRQLIIVAGSRARLYEHLKRGFAGNGTVRVLLNRRVMARRARSGPYEAERRQADRRLPSKVDALCARLAGPSCPWMSQRIIIETLPSSDRSRWMVAKTDLSLRGVVSVTGSPVIRPAPISDLARADSTYGNRDHATKASPSKAISNKLA